MSPEVVVRAIQSHAVKAIESLDEESEGNGKREGRKEAFEEVNRVCLTILELLHNEEGRNAKPQ